MNAVILGFVVVERINNGPKEKHVVVSRRYTVRSAAEIFAQLLHKHCPGIYYVRDVVGDEND